jgi:hypothetical protein
MNPFRNPTSSKWRSIARVCCLLVPLAGCSQPSPPNPQDAVTPGSASQAYGQPIRVIVKFSQDVPYRGEGFLQDMQERIHARVSYVSSVSQDTHVYQLEPQAGQSAAQTLQGLAAVPLVLRVEIDARVQAQ